MAKSPVPEEAWQAAEKVYPTQGGDGASEVLKALGHNVKLNTIVKRMNERGVFDTRVKTTRAKWTPEEDAILQSNQEFTTQELADMLDGRSVNAVESRAKTLGLSLGVGQQVKHDREVESLRREVKVLKRKYNEAVKQGNTEDTILELMREYHQRIPIPKAATQKVRRRAEVKESLVVLLSDLHIGETVSLEATHGLNRYDTEVAIARLEMWMERVIAISQEALKGYQFEELVIYLLGDLINGQFGAMHDELLVTQSAQLMETVYGTAYLLNQVIVNMLQHFENIRVVAVPGNHGRMTKKPWAKEAAMNWDSIIPQIMSTQFAGSTRVKFDIPNSFFFIDDVKGWKFLGLHGHQIRGWAGIPWYGINRIIGNLDEVFTHEGIEIHNAVMGHFHSGASMEKVKGEVLANPCLKGTDEYALGSGFKPSPAAQLIMGVHEKHGITHRWKVDVQDAFESNGTLKWWPGGTLQEAWAE